jgi:glutamine synthetase
VADVLCEIADELDKARDVKATAQKILHEIAVTHARIVFNGDNYAEEWIAEAERRALPNIRSTVESLRSIPSKQNIALFTKHGVLTKHELKARTEVLLEVYSRQINIEALTMLSMAKRQILPACCEYSVRLGQAVAAVSGAGVSAETQTKLLKHLCELIATLENSIETLENTVEKAAAVQSAERHAESCREDVVPAMAALRQVADELETIVDAELWPLPSYAEMLFLR